MSKDPLLQPYQLKHLSLRNRIPSLGLCVRGCYQEAAQDRFQSLRNPTDLQPHLFKRMPVNQIFMDTRYNSNAPDYSIQLKLFD